MADRERLLAVGKDFLNFLQRHKVDINDRPNEYVKKFYTTHFKTYFDGRSGGKELPPFNDVKDQLLRKHAVRMKNKRFYTDVQETGKAQSLAKNVAIKDVSSQNGASANNQNVGKANQEDDKPKKKRRRSKKVALKLAVDQHITFNRSLSTDSTQVNPPDSPPNKQATGNVIYSRRAIPTQNASQNAQDTEKSSHFQKTKKMTKDGVQIYEFYCTVCNSRNFITTENDIGQHILSKTHKSFEWIKKLEKNRKELIKNKNGVTVEADCDMSNGELKMNVNKLEKKSVKIKIKNTSASDAIRLLNYSLVKRLRMIQLNDEKQVGHLHSSVIMMPGQVYTVTVSAHPREIGHYHAPLLFEFAKEGQAASGFHIVRFISIICKNAVVTELQPTTKFQHPPRVAHLRQASERIKGHPLPPLSSDELEKKLSLAFYSVPDGTRHIINRGLKDTKGLTEAEDDELTSLQTMLEKSLDIDLYFKRFLSLMHFEEIQMEVDIRKYDMTKVTMTICKENTRLLLLKVPGLAEKRPSVLRGDWLFARPLQSDGTMDDKEYQGIVHEVRLDEVALGFHESLLGLFVPNMQFAVRFVINRLPLRIQYRACELAEELSMKDVLFPKPGTVCKMGTMQPLETTYRFFDRKLETNAQQVQAIKHIVSGTSRPAPYLVFGPPGTGKTVTIVEAMKQVWNNFPNSHILGCAPSNSAADLMTERLLNHIPPKQILRLVASSRPWISIPEKVQPVCNYDRHSRQYFYLKKERLQKYRIIITTLVTAGRLASANFPSEHFTHVFIDESGHAQEPECLIPISGVIDISPHVKEGGQVVLAGDPKQLGPIMRSPFAVKYGLDVSLLERYMTDCEVYGKKHDTSKGDSSYDKRLITKLLNNYRSHPKIMEVPNEMFYDNELIMNADPIIRESFCKWDTLPTKGFPVIFHSVIGKDLQEERSPSFFNPEEASLVLDYTKQLLENTRAGMKIKPSDIGIISPYRKQVQKIKNQLKKNKTPDVFVGSVEEFQGQERMIIIVSTVRSNPEYLSLDSKFKLGFLKSPKRFNVTLTRAKALLIVIGNPFTLSKDDCWKRFITFCEANGGFTGTDFTSEKEELDYIMQRLAALNLSDKSEVPSTEEASLYNEQGWNNKD